MKMIQRTEHDRYFFNSTMFRMDKLTKEDWVILTPGAPLINMV